MSKLRAAFAGSHSRSVTFAHIAGFLESEGVEVFWIMPGAQFRIDYLKKLGFSSDKILNLSDIENTLDDSLLAELESYSEVTASYIVMSDRNLCRKNGREALGYLCSVFSSVKKFLTDNRIDIVFTEATWAYELVSCAAARSVGAEFLVPHTVRYPFGRFAFFRDIFQREILDTGRAAEVGVIAPSAAKMNNSELNLVSLRGFFRHLVFAFNGRGRDAVSNTFAELVSDRLKRLVNKKLSGFSKMTRSIDSPYVYFPLHCQPEASIDVMGGFYSGQLELIRNISRSLPAGLKLAVKEHPLGIGMRRIGFFRSIEKLPNAVNINPCADSIDLIKNASAVVSVSGTACYEAAVMGVGSVVFSDVFFGELPSVVRCRSYEEIGGCLSLAMGAQKDSAAVSVFLSKIYSVSYEGCVEPAELFPEAVSDENARMVAQAFMDVIDNYSSSASKDLTAASMSSR